MLIYCYCNKEIYINWCFVDVMKIHPTLAAGTKHAGIMYETGRQQVRNRQAAGTKQAGSRYKTGRQHVLIFRLLPRIVYYTTRKWLKF